MVEGQGYRRNKVQINMLSGKWMAGEANLYLGVEKSRKGICRKW